MLAAFHKCKHSPDMRILTLITSIFIGLSGCALFEEPTKPELRPNGIKPAPKLPPVSIESKQDTAYYIATQARLKAKGFLRQDVYPEDAKFTEADLVENFERITFFDEFTNYGDQNVQEQNETTLRRWDKPIYIGLNFGPSVPEKQRIKDRSDVKKYAKRLASLTGLKIQVSDARKENFSLLFLNKDEQHDLLSTLAKKITYIDQRVIDQIALTPRSIYCSAYLGFLEKPRAPYLNAVILIRAENPNLLRKSCIHEEMAQALGLKNDDPDARPSIFNDDEEFALLTRHDELLLKMLYDPRLSIGLTRQDAHPIVQEIAKELLALGRT